MPTVDSEKVIGVRMPLLRKLAKELSGTVDADAFLEELPHEYYEENNLHLLLIGTLRDYGNCVRRINVFLPYIDNWATCDIPAPKVFRKYLDELIKQVRVWITSEDTYTVRFGIGMLMQLYLDEAFRPEYPALVAAVESEEYYVNMMRAWYFTTALAKQYETALPYIEEQRLDIWTHNKTIQKAVESYRITPEQKAYLRMKRR